MLNRPDDPPRDRHAARQRRYRRRQRNGETRLNPDFGLPFCPVTAPFHFRFQILEDCSPLLIAPVIPHR
jgi:hypothetical protein